MIYDWIQSSPPLVQEGGKRIFRSTLGQSRDEYLTDQKMIQCVLDIINTVHNSKNNISESIKTIHEAWMIAREINDKLTHPLAPTIRAWMKDQNAKRISKEYDPKHPAAVLKYPMGNIRELTFIDADSARLRNFTTPERIAEINPAQQIFEFAKPHPSILPPVMPLEVSQPHGLPLTTKKGAVSHVLRIFDEALMALKPSEHQADIIFTLEDLINYLYPGYRREDGRSYDHTKFNRTLQLPYIIRALDVLHFYATVPWDNGNGRWRPVVVRTPIAQDARNLHLSITHIAPLVGFGTNTAQRRRD